MLTERAALEAAVEQLTEDIHRSGAIKPRVLFLTDCMSLLMAIKGLRPKTVSEYSFRRKLSGLATTATLVLRHVKGHVGVDGNEVVDRAANEARESPPQCASILAPEAVKSELKRLVQLDRVEGTSGAANGSRLQFFC